MSKADLYHQTKFINIVEQTLPKQILPCCCFGGYACGGIEFIPGMDKLDHEV